MQINLQRGLKRCAEGKKMKRELGSKAAVILTEQQERLRLREGSNENSRGTRFGNAALIFSSLRVTCGGGVMIRINSIPSVHFTRVFPRTRSLAAVAGGVMRKPRTASPPSKPLWSL